MKYKYGFIGCGNMGSAMIGGIISAGLAQPSEIGASCHSSTTKERISEKLGICVVAEEENAASNAAVVADSKMVILAVKPYQLDGVLEEIRDALTPEHVVVSVVAGRSMDSIKQALATIDVAGRLPIARAMPNTPALVGEAMSGVCYNECFTAETKAEVMDLFNSFGKAACVTEHDLAVVTGLSGSSPAFIYMLIEAMADEGVRQGLKRDVAYTFAAQSVLGSAKMVLETGEHPGVLKDAVCSPAGTTIAGVRVLEEDGFRASIMDAIGAACDKARGV